MGIFKGKKKDEKWEKEPTLPGETELSGFSIIRSFNDAIEGILYAFKTQRNIKIHFIATAIIILLSVFLSISKIELILILITVTVVFIAEMFNTAVEMVVDYIVARYHPLARIAKDIAAGAVLFAAVNAVVVGFLVFFDRLKTPALTTIVFITRNDIYVAIAALTLTVIMVIVIKAVYGKGTPLRGGLPSGHSAVAFGVWTIITFITKDPLVSVLTAMLAGLIAISRIRQKVHTFFEVAAGISLGVGIAALLFWVSKLVGGIQIG
ncbi:MAG: phosphatase PAP2 family protein [bacterium]|nr:phosphatase PAP2 family protein [bacterium]